MRYLQRDIAFDETKSNEWSSALGELRQHWDEYHERMPASAQKLEQFLREVDLHDASVTGIEHSPQLRRVTIKTEMAIVQFQGVKSFSQDEDEPEFAWLYDEIVYVDQNHFEFNLLGDACELSIVAESVEVLPA